MSEASETTGLEGQWSITIHGPTGPQETLLKIESVDGVLGGTQSALGQVEKVLDMVYDSASGKFSWVNKIKKPLPMSLKFVGTVIDGTTMSGAVNAAIMGAFPFTGVKR
jgi:hypothetical protein